MNASTPLTLPIPGPVHAHPPSLPTRNGVTPTATGAGGSASASVAPDVLHVHPRGDGVFELADAGERTVGWIRGSAIRLGAFATEQAAVEAALLGARVLDAHLGDPTSPPTDVADHAPGREPPRDVRLVHDGAYEWVVLGRRLLARLIRPARSPIDHGAPDVSPALGRGTALPDHAPFSLEFVVPAPVASATRLTLARALYRALAPRRITPPAEVVLDALGHPLVATRSAQVESPASTPATSS